MLRVQKMDGKINNKKNNFRFLKGHQALLKRIILLLLLQLDVIIGIKIILNGMTSLMKRGKMYLELKNSGKIKRRLSMQLKPNGMSLFVCQQVVEKVFAFSYLLLLNQVINFMFMY